MHLARVAVAGAKKKRRSSRIFLAHLRAQEVARTCGTHLPRAAFGISVMSGQSNNFSMPTSQLSILARYPLPSLSSSLPLDYHTDCVSSIGCGENQFRTKWDVFPPRRPWDSGRPICGDFGSVTTLHVSTEEDVARTNKNRPGDPW